MTGIPISGSGSVEHSSLSGDVRIPGMKDGVKGWFTDDVIAAAVSAYAAAAASSAGEAASSADASAASASAAGSSAFAAGTSAAASASSAATALAAAFAASASTIFATKSAANAGIASVAANAYIQVLVDESRSNSRTVYQKVTGSYVYVFTFPSALTLYADSNDGDDANTGLTADSAKETLAATVALMTKGDTLALKRGSRFFESLTGMPTYTSFVAYGYGNDPIIDGSRLISAGAWTADPTYADQWYADVTHETATATTGSVQASGTHFGVFVEADDAPYVNTVPYWAGASIAANRLYISTRDYYMTCHRQGSTTQDPRTDSNSTLYRYYIKLPTGVDPSAADVDVYYAEQVQVMTLTVGCRASDMVAQRTASKDMTGHNQNQAEIVERVTFLEPAVHAWVGGAIFFRSCRAICTRVSADDPTQTMSNYWDGGGFHGFHDTSALGVSRGFIVDDCYAEGIGQGVYSHGTGVTNEHVTGLVRKFTARNCDIAVTAGSTDKGYDIEELIAIDCDSFVSCNPGTRIKRSRFIAREHNSGGPWPALLIYGSTYVEDTVFILPGSENYLYANNVGSGNLALELVRCTKAGGFGIDNSAGRRGIDLAVTDCVLGQLDKSGSGYPLNDIVANNTQLAIHVRTLADIQADYPDVDDDCVVPYVIQTYERTIVSADLAYRASVNPGTVSGSSGTHTLAADFISSSLVGYGIKVVNWNGSGGEFITTVTATDGNGAPGDLTVADALPGNIVSKAITLAYFGRQVFPESAGTCVFSNDGTQIYLSNPEHFTDGQTIYIGALNRRDPVGVRTITALAGSTATLDRAYDWTQNATSITYETFGSSGSTTGVARPTFPVAFAFVMRGDDGGAFPGPSLEITRNTAGVNVSTEEAGNGQFGSFENRLASTGVAVDYGTIRHERGYIDAAFQIAIDDDLAIGAVAYIGEYTPTFEGDPTLSGQAVLLRGSLLAELGMGARGSG